MTYDEAVNAPEMRRENYLPEGLVEGCKLKRDIPKMRSSPTPTSISPRPPRGPVRRQEQR